MASNFNISYRIQALDAFSAVGRRIARTTNRLRAAMQGATAAVGRFGDRMRGLDRTEDRLAARRARRIDQFNNRVRNTGAAMTAGLTLPLLLFGKQALKQSAISETMVTGFEAMLGSGTKAKKLFGELVKFTAETPFRLQGVGAASKILLAAGVGAEDMTNKLQTLGDVAAGTPRASIADLAQIFGKAKSQGKVMTMELLQLSRRGIPIIGAIAERFNVPKAVVFKAAEKSLLSFDILKLAFKDLTSQGGVFYQQMIKQSKTLMGEWSDFEDNVDAAMSDIGDTISKVFGIKSLLNVASLKVRDIARAFKEFAAANPIVTKFLTILVALVSIIGPLILLAGLLAIAMTAISWPVLAVIGGITLLVAAFVTLKSEWSGIQETIFQFFDKLPEKIKAFGEWFANNNPLAMLGRGISSLFSSSAAAELDVASKSQVDINLNVAGNAGAVSGMESKVKGPANLNTGMNLAAG